MNRAHPCCLLLFSFGTTITASAESVEAAFADARTYTVYIETRIATPFIGDEAGSHIGAGFVVDRDRGWIVTNAHVAGRSPASISVAFDGGRKMPVSPVYIDSYIDVAILKPTGTVPPAQGEAALDCGAAPRIGAAVGAYGHPEGFKFTGSRGIVSGFPSLYGLDYLQTDAPVSHGNSGGPLIDLANGRVVGVNTSIYAEKSAQNINFAIESKRVCRILEIMRSGGDPRPPDLGLLFYSDNGERGVTIAHASGAGLAAGLAAGDRILAVDGAPLSRPTEGELIHMLRGKPGYAEFMVESRDGSRREVTVDLRPQDNVTQRVGLLVGGALIAPSNHADAILLSDAPKLMVHSVVPGSEAESAPLGAYDHLIAVNGRRVTSMQELAATIEANRSESTTLEVLRFVGEENRFSEYARASVHAEAATWVGFSNGRVDYLASTLQPASAAH